MSTEILHPALRGDADKLLRICAGSLFVIGLLLLPVPAAVARVLQLDGASEVGIRIVGVVWMVLGVGFGVFVGRAVPRHVVTAAMIVLALNAVFLLVGPFLFRLQVGWFGWIVLALLALMSGAGATAWFFLRDRIVTATARKDRAAAGV
jgi:hypothetical protein